MISLVIVLKVVKKEKFSIVNLTQGDLALAGIF